MTLFDDDGDVPRDREIVLAQLRDALSDLCDVLFEEDGLDEVEVVVNLVLRQVLLARGVE